MAVRFGIIGAGNISRFHFNGLEKAGAAITHVVDINETAAKPWADKFGAKYSKDYRALIDDKNVDAVAILVHSRFHREIALAALNAGKDIVCEKTMMDNAAEAAEVAAKVKASKQLFFTAFMKRFFPAAQKAKELMPSIGRVFSAHVRSYQPWGDLFNLASGANHEWILKNYGGAIIKCAGSHMLDMMLWLLGRPECVSANIDFIPSSNIDRQATAMFSYADGTSAIFETAGHPLSKIGLERLGWDEYIEVNGTDGRLTFATVVWDKPERHAPILTHYDNRTGATTEYRFDIVNPFDVEMKHFCSCIEARVQRGPDVIDGFAVDTVIDSMFAAAKQRSSVEIDWKGL
ncbi:MAG: Gfo/Idh/MocA family oxidoreductase [Spirochaetes bacterium]|nr:Gfo/Idh/MocA family oxidoreductase [Spirochaetota bacterium]